MSELTLSLIAMQVILFVVLFLVVYFAVAMTVVMVRWLKMAINWLLPPLNDG